MLVGTIIWVNALSSTRRILAAIEHFGFQELPSMKQHRDVAHHHLLRLQKKQKKKRPNAMIKAFAMKDIWIKPKVNPNGGPVVLTVKEKKIELMVVVVVLALKFQINAKIQPLPK